jgi:hypothetical protein
MRSESARFVVLSILCFQERIYHIYLQSSKHELRCGEDYVSLFRGQDKFSTIQV